ncbi:hypothetical protein B296_00010190 [Ensete ventricosum]|uniref:Uncharacterized protein n=1 Tax=Ensete ventricosum TaxID=4639 RepID=A0A427AUT0_ENSVE|nr:hypothetical protein B296_00010190 [Ensete ventricosum]
MPLWTSPLYELAASTAPKAWPWAGTAPCGLAVGGHCPCNHRQAPPLIGDAPAGALATIDCPCRGPARGRSPSFLTAKT